MTAELTALRALLCASQWSVPNAAKACKPPTTGPELRARISALRGGKAVLAECDEKRAKRTAHSGVATCLPIKVYPSSEREREELLECAQRMGMSASSWALGLMRSELEACK